ncbi:MAG: UDP-glucose--hexose-1-phosphate uridylyltransferase, partial [Firmicutes bacterium]|nr:UDP-glucose--hexose-1-phosphate uridylyltransferase [Candidatus Caballimonas caccae]
MIDGKILIEKLLRYSEDFLHLSKRDEIYFRNLLLREFNLTEPNEKEIDLSEIDSLDVPDTLVSDIENFARENNLCLEGEENLYSTYIMGLLSPLPSKVNEEFVKIKNSEGIRKACDYFYNLSVKNNYVQKTAISKNILWTFNDNEKYLEITINLSKPEKNNKDIAKLLSASRTTNHSACLLCKENEGFKGNVKHPARENIRTISVNLDGEKWFVQYSPYAYFNEHLIAINEEHKPMVVNDGTIRKLADFVDIFPNYMIGSNAALPIVGGSILNHEHYQGGGHLMPMHNAKIKAYFTALKHKKVKVGIVDWYNSVIRLESKNRSEIINLASEIVSAWANYTDSDLGIFSETDGVLHNTLAPVCRKTGKTYIYDLILRNNITSEEYPDGVFHAHPEYHNIKKEGIGLIEAMGLYILPGRLKKQLAEISDILVGNNKVDIEELSKEEHPLYVHRNMIKELLKDGVVSTKEEADKKIRDKVNNVCKNILLNTAVFKKDEKGEQGFIKFLN